MLRQSLGEVKGVSQELVRADVKANGVPHNIFDTVEGTMIELPNHVPLDDEQGMKILQYILKIISPSNGNGASHSDPEAKS
jgi:hypothetical protein